MTCPWCGSPVSREGSLLGRLGSREHYRCQCCGSMFSRRMKDRGRERLAEIADQEESA